MKEKTSKATMFSFIIMLPLITNAEVSSTVGGPEFIPGCTAHSIEGWLDLIVDDGDNFDQAHDVYVYLLSDWGAVLDQSGSSLLSKPFDRLTSDTWGHYYEVDGQAIQLQEYCIATHEDYRVTAPTFNLFTQNCATAPSRGGQSQ